MRFAHGGEIQSAALRLGITPGQLLDASASLVPWTPRFSARELTRGLRDYPDRLHHQLVGLIIILDKSKKVNFNSVWLSQIGNSMLIMVQANGKASSLVI